MSEYTNLPTTADQLDEAVDFAIMGLLNDGGHHKQWCLEQVIIRLGVDLEELRQELTAEGYSWEEGIAP